MWVALAAVVTLLVSAPAVQAAKATGGNKMTMSGCGLGYMLFGHENPSNRALQVLALTTNGTSANQLFGITSGTSGCTQDGVVALNKELEVYAEVNLPNLSVEMAKGEGEYVAAFASLLGATDAARPALLKFFQERYEVLFPSQDTTAAQMLETLKAELGARPDLLG
jgi:hypothetical protein